MKIYQTLETISKSASAFTSNQIKITANLANIEHPYKEVKAMADVLKAIVRDSIETVSEMVNDHEELQEFVDGLNAIPNALNYDFWDGSVDELFSTVWRWAIGSERRVSIFQNIAIEYFRLGSVVTWLVQKRIGYEDFLNPLIMNLYHKMHFWVWKADDWSKAEDVIGLSTLQRYSDMSDADLKQEMAKFSKKQILEVISFEKFCAGTGVEDYYKEAVNLQDGDGWEDKNDLAAIDRKYVKQAKLVREEEFQAALWSKRMQTELGIKPRRKSLYTEPDEGVEEQKQSSEKTDYLEDSKATKEQPEDVDPAVLKIRGWTDQQLTQEIYFIKQDKERTGLIKEEQARLDLLLEEQEKRKERQANDPFIYGEPQQPRTEYINGTFEFDVTEFPRDQWHNALVEFEEMIKGWSIDMLKNEIFKLAVEAIIYAPDQKEPIKVPRCNLHNLEHEQLLLMQGQLAVAQKKPADTYLDSQSHKELTACMREEGEVYLELKRKNPNSRSAADIIITPELAAKIESDKTLPPAESEKKKAPEPSSDIVTKVINCLNKIRDLDAAKKGRQIPLRVGHIAQLIKSNRSATAPTVWELIARENKDTPNPEAAKLEHILEWNRDEMTPKDFMEQDKVPLGEATRRSEKWNKGRKITKNEWKEGKYKIHPILHPDVQAFIRAHFDLGESMKAKYKDGDEFEYYSPQGNSSEQVDIPPLVEDLCRLVDLNKEVDDYERYYKKTWEGKEIKSKKQEKKEAAAK